MLDRARYPAEPGVEDLAPPHLSRPELEQLLIGRQVLDDLEHVVVGRMGPVPRRCELRLAQELVGRRREVAELGLGPRPGVLLVGLLGVGHFVTCVELSPR